jgi:hypothetical protein
LVTVLNLSHRGLFPLKLLPDFLELGPQAWQGLLCTCGYVYKLTLILQLGK